MSTVIKPQEFSHLLRIFQEMSGKSWASEKFLASNQIHRFNYRFYLDDLAILLRSVPQGGATSLEEMADILEESVGNTHQYASHEAAEITVHNRATLIEMLRSPLHLVAMYVGHRSTVPRDLTDTGFLREGDSFVARLALWRVFIGK